ncbi:hypothetical protein LWI29_002696 [Acer saccharum]|uniref:CCHC-type domain-containing protein n=1 Tax=Acer saccharum TaxID=4024 RepID=A0AA39SXC5_ACESA|nr:hypothetical protein LWI29_002696 [Acer saccharum]
MYMNRRAAKSIAEEIDQVIEIPAEEKDCRGKFLRVKVRIEITKPLKRFIKLAVDETEKVVIVPLVYERLPEFCYACGKLGHVLRECPDDEARIEALEGVSTKFGAWMRATGPDTGKLKPQKQMGKRSSGQGEGKSNSISDGAVRGTDECRIDQIQTHNSEEAVSRGSVGKITSGNENARQPIEICKELSQDRGTYLIGPPLVSDMNTDNRDRWSMVSRMEKESEGAFVAMEDVETYSEGHAADMIHNINDQGEGAKDQGNTSKRNVRTWKRVARGNSTSLQTEDLGHSDTKITRWKV